MGFDSTDLRRSRSGLALSKVRKHRVEASAATVAAEADCEPFDIAHGLFEPEPQNRRPEPTEGQTPFGL